MAPQTGRIRSHIVFLVILTKQSKLTRNTFRMQFIATTCSDIRFLIGRCEFRIGRCAYLRLDNDPTQNLSLKNKMKKMKWRTIEIKEMTAKLPQVQIRDVEGASLSRKKV